jgi:hypothetical protein
MATNLSWLPGLITQDEGSVKFLNGTNLAFTGIETLIVDGPVTNALHEFNTDTFGSAHYVIHAECGSDQRETLNVSVVAKLGKASITVYGRINTGVNLIDVQADITDSILVLYATPAVVGLQDIKVTAFATLAEVIVDSSSKATVYYFTKVNGTPAFTINTGPYSSDDVKPALTFYKGLTYRFDQSYGTNDLHPLVIGTIADDVNSIYVPGISYYLNNKKVTKADYINPALFLAATNRYIEISVADTYPAALYYFSSATAGLGNAITVTTLSDSGSTGGSGSGGTGGGGGTITGAATDLSNLEPTSINVSLLPGVTSSIDLGSASKRWKDLYLSGNSLILGDAVISATGSAVNLPAGSTINGTVIGTGGHDGGASILNDLTDVNITSPAAGQVLKYDGVSWYNGTDESGTGGGGASGNSFSTIEIAGQSQIIADSSADTLTLVAGPNITLTTNAGGDTITISASSSGGGGASGVSAGVGNRLAYYPTTGSVVADTGAGLSWNGEFLQVLGTLYATGAKSYVRANWASLNDLNIEAPANTWRGMVAYAQDTGKLYYAHSGVWNRLANFADIPTSANAFGTIQIDGQANVVADGNSDTVTFIAGVGMTITTNADNDTITFASSGGGGGGGITTEDAQDATASMFTGGTHTGITFVYNDTNNTVNATVNANAGIYTDEQAADAAALILTTGTHSGISFTYNDLAGTLNATVTYPTMYSDENAQDAVAPMFVSGSHTGISYVYADASNVMNVTVSSEYIQDQAAALLTAGTHSNISFNYVDASNRIDASVSLPAAYTDENAVDAVGAALTTGTHTGISFTYSSTQDAANRIDATVSYANVVLTGTTTLQQSTKVLNNKTGSAGVSTFTVTNSGSSAYLINGDSNPTLNLVRGVTYTFNVNATGHPFWIKTAQATGTGSAYSTGVTNNGAAVGTVTFAVPLDAPSTLYYICQIHAGMVGTLSISNAPIVVHDYATGDEFYHSGMLSNFTANFTNVPTTGDRIIKIAVSLLQGASPYGITAIQINGASQTLRWKNNTVPTYGGLNSIDVAIFTLFRTGASWIAIGDVVGY